MNNTITLNKKAVGVLTVVLASLTALSPFAIDTYAPAMPYMAKSLSTLLPNIELSLTIYIIGYAIGQFFGGPLSDNFGRKPIVYIGLSVFILSSYFLSVCTSVNELYFWRFTQALGGGFSIVISMAIIRDLFSGTELARRISYVGMFMMAAPLVAPAVGTALMKMIGWRAIFAFLGAYSLLVIVLMIVFIPETKKSNNWNSKLLKKVIGNYWSVFSNMKAMSYVLAAALGFSGMYTFITGSSKLYLEHFKLPLDIYPLLFGSNVLLMIILGALNARLVTKISPKKILNIGLLVQLAVGAMLYMVLLNGNAPFEIVFPLIVLFVGVLGLIFANANAMVLDMYPNSSGTTTAVIGVIEFSVAGIVGFISHALQDESIVPIGLVMFGCTLASNLFYRVLGRLSNKKEVIKITS